MHCPLADVRILRQLETGVRSCLDYREEVATLIKNTLKENNLAVQSIAGYASIDIKEDEPAISSLHNVNFFSAEELNAFAPKLKTPSGYVMAEVGTPGVAEAAALAAAGPDAELIVPKVRDG